MSAIFISYRRDDSSGYAGRLFDRLVQRFGRERLFMDIENLEPGMDFVAAIDRAIASCGAVIALIGPDWLSARDAQGRARLDDPHDFIRLEIAAALKRDIRVIPVLVHGAEMPQEQDLPEPLRPLARLQATELSDNRWEFDVGRLADVLEPLLGRRGQTRNEPARTAGRGALWAGLAAGLAALAGLGWWALQPAPPAGGRDKTKDSDLQVEQPDREGPRLIVAEAGSGGQPSAAIESQAEVDTGAVVAAPGQVAALGYVTGKGSAIPARTERAPAVTASVRPQAPRVEPLAPPPPSGATERKDEPAAVAPASSPQADRERRVARLLAQADEDLRSNRLTRPPEANALARYRQVLALDPGNAQAQEGIRRIGVRYRRLAEQALADGRVAAARRHLAAAASVDPKLPWLASMRRRIAKAQAATVAPVSPPAPAAPQTGANECRQGCREAQSACRESARGRGEGCLAGVKAQCEKEYKACMSDSNLAMIWGRLAHQSECSQAQALCERKGRERCDAAPDEALARCDAQAERCLADCR